MKVPLSWLKDYVDIDIPVEELAEKLTSIGVPVENIEYICPKVTKVKVGYIKEVKKHPNADKLVLCDVDLGKVGIHQIVTGAPNVRKGHKVPVALHGAILNGNLKIKRSKIRGEKSEGMMCSAKELGLDIKDLPQDQREGVLILPTDTPAGEDIVKLYCLNDPILEVEVFANRPDHLSILGIARETAAALGKDMKMPLVDFETINENTADFLGVSINNYDLCKKYSGRIVKDTPIKDSPLWMQGRLYAAGVRAVNNVVDITNYIMLETGQPLHAFDYDKVSDKKIVVRSAKEGEKIVTLDSKERILNSSVLVITDNKGPLALAGVMGGIDSEINSDTKRILLESASFNQASIRRTSIKMGLRSESSKRFEKGIDFYQVDLASRRACHLLQKLGGKVFKGEACDSINPPKASVIILRPFRVNKILGTDNINKDIIRTLLGGINFKVEDEGENLNITVPTVRQDVKEEIDLVEEVARLYGYDKIPTTEPQGISMGVIEEDVAFDDYLRKISCSCGLNECITLSMYDQKTMKTYNLQKDNLLQVKNPITEDQEILRDNAVPHLIDVLKRNISMKQNILKIFELSKFYNMENVDIKERREMTFLMSGPKNTPNVDFFALKGILEYIFKSLRIESSFVPGKSDMLHPNKAADIFVNGEKIGIIGLLHPMISNQVGLNQEVVVSRIFVDSLRKMQKLIQYKPIPKFPGMERDIAVVLNKDTPAAKVESIALQEGKPIIDEAYCFDVYEGKQVPDGMKSLAFSLKFSKTERTLTDKEVQEKIDNIINKLQEELNAKLRT